MDLRCVNWFEGRGEERVLFLKARARDGETVFVRFPYNYYYVVTQDALAAMFPRPPRAHALGEFEVAAVDEVLARSYHVRPRPRTRARLWLLEERTRRDGAPSAYLSEHMHVTWFFITNDIAPDGCYRVQLDKLLPLTPQCYHCDSPREFFATRVPLFEITRTYLFFDIECCFDKKFPSVFCDPVSHISCCYVDKAGAEVHFSLVNSDLLSEDQLRGHASLRSADEFAPRDGAITFCPERVLLQLARRMLESPFDYVVTFNGNNFDIRYLAGRLELLAGEYVLFRRPDHAETVKLCIYERHLASHRGAGGMSNTSFHINNNNGSIFFDLYTYMQKTERLDSYKLDSISKNAFYCTARVAGAAGAGECWLEGSPSTDSGDRVRAFSEVLATGNYVTLDSMQVCAILEKEVTESGFRARVRVPGDVPAEGAQCEVAFGKDDVDLRDMYKHYSAAAALEMERYCMHDACLCKYLWRHYRIPSKIDAAAATYLLPQCLSLEYKASTLIKGPLLKIMLQEQIVFTREGAQRRFPYSGGTVFAPKQKILTDNVMVFDYNSLYPSVCLFANLSPETLVCVVGNQNKLDAEVNASELLARFPPPDFIVVVCEPRSPDLFNEIAVYDRRRRGVIPKLLNMFMERRKHYKGLLRSADNAVERALYDSMQYVYKIVANSVYGLMGFYNSSLYSYASAKCCTTIGRRMIAYLDETLNGASLQSGVLRFATEPRHPLFATQAPKSACVDVSEALGRELALQFRSVYGDTDSVFIAANTRDVETTMRVARKMESLINEYLLFENFRVEFEAVYCNLILQSKKKYTTLKYDAGRGADAPPVRINKGTSETRRDVSRMHKVMIHRYKTRILELMAEGMPSARIGVEVLRSLETDLLAEFSVRQAPLEMFLLSRTHHRNYKAADNPNVALVNAYNRDNAEPIEVGERYFYAYFCDAALPWQTRLTNIKTHEQIVDACFVLTDRQRIFYEVYFKRIATEVVNLLDNRALATRFFTQLFGVRPAFTT
uniref:DNA polymerase n=1 Tax=Rousettus bat poxvirus TaxID=3141933 RepID=A0AAU7E0I6_9POXV